MNTSYRHIFKATSLFGGVQCLSILLSLVRTKIVAVLLGAEGVGLNSIYNHTKNLIYSTTNLGLDVSGVRGISSTYEKIQKTENDEDRKALSAELTESVAVLRSWVLLLALMGVLLCMLCAVPLSRFIFGDYGHIWDLIILSPAVGFSTIACGEMAVLKGFRELRSIAAVSVQNVIAGLLCTVPIYWRWGMRGVLPALLILCCVVMALTQIHSYRVIRPKFFFTRKKLEKGHEMLSVGINFVLCSIAGHLALLVIQAYLNNRASLETVGLYHAGYTLTMTYAGLVFSAMESDYFPRLSGVMEEKKARCDTLLKQQDIVVWIVSPLLAALIVFLPVLVPILFSSSFKAMVPMAQVTAVGLLFRAIYLPSAYLSLAAGDNKTFLLINIIGSADLLLVLVGYEFGGLLGIGAALTVQNFIDMLLVMVIARKKYEVEYGKRRLFDLFLYSMSLFVVYLVCHRLSGWMYWTGGLLLTFIVAMYSIIKLKRHF